MTYIEYAKKLGIELNSAQLQILNECEKGNDVIANFPRMQGRAMLQNLISESRGYNRGYQQGIEDAIEECVQILQSAIAEDGKTKCTVYLKALNEMEQMNEQNKPH